LVKHVGITSHNPENILRALKGFDFGTVLLPVNYVLGAHPEPKNDYKPVLALARERKIGVIAMKSIAKEPWPTSAKTHNTWYHPFETQKEIDEAVRFTLSQGVTTATTSSDVRIARMMIEAAERYKPMSKREQKEMLMKASGYRPLFPRVPG
jgi:predicted aldo/keto reductase-like oxidoreductase